MQFKSKGEPAYGAAAPVVQKTGKQRFLTDHPSEMFSKGQFRKKTILAGVVAQEGSFIVGGLHNLRAFIYSHSTFFKLFKKSTKMYSI